MRIFAAILCVLTLTCVLGIEAPFALLGFVACLGLAALNEKLLGLVVPAIVIGVMIWGFSAMNPGSYNVTEPRPPVGGWGSPESIAQTKRISEYVKAEEDKATKAGVPFINSKGVFINPPREPLRLP